MLPADWFLTADERDNPSTLLDRRHPDGGPGPRATASRRSCTARAYFAALGEARLADRRGRPAPLHRLARRPGRAADRRAAAPRSPTLFAAAAAARGRRPGAGVALPPGPAGVLSATRTATSARRSSAAGGECAARHAGAHRRLAPPEVRRAPPPAADPSSTSPSSAASTCATAGATTPSHDGDPQPSRWPRRTAHGPPWHDVQVAIRGPAVGDVETVFRERWEDPHAAHPQPAAPAARPAPPRPAPHADPLPAAAARPAAPAGPHRGPAAAHLPARSAGYPFAPRRRAQRRPRLHQGARARPAADLPRGPVPLVRRGRAHCFAAALRAHPSLRLVAVAPAPPRPGRRGRRCRRTSSAAAAAARRCCTRPAATGSPSTGSRTTHGTPGLRPRQGLRHRRRVGHASGSDNFNRRSWTHDSELSAAVVHPDVRPRLRHELAREHLDTGGDVALDDHFDGVAASAEALAAWHREPGAAPRPPRAAPAARQPRAEPADPAVGRSALPPRLRPGRPTAGPAAATDLLRGTSRPYRGARAVVGWARAHREVHDRVTTRHTASSRATPAAR